MSSSRNTTIQKSKDNTFLNNIWNVMRNVEPNIGVGVEIYGHAELLGGEVKAGSKLIYYLPKDLDVLVGGSVGVNLGCDLPNWAPASIYGELTATLSGWMAASVEVNKLNKIKLSGQLCIAIPGVSLGGRPLPVVEVDCIHLELCCNPCDMSKVSIYCSAGAGLQLPFLPDIGKLLVQMSPKLRAKASMFGILRFDVPTKYLPKY